MWVLEDLQIISWSLVRVTASVGGNKNQLCILVLQNTAVRISSMAAVDVLLLVGNTVVTRASLPPRFNFTTLSMAQLSCSISLNFITLFSANLPRKVGNVTAAKGDQLELSSCRDSNYISSSSSSSSSPIYMRFRLF